MRPAPPLRRLARGVLAIAAAAGSAAAAAAQQPAVAFTDEVLEITPMRLASLVAGLRAEDAARPALEREHEAQLARYRAASDAFPARIAEYERDVAAWQGRRARYEACVKPIEDGLETGAAASADRAQMTGMASRLDTPEFKATMEARAKALAAQVQAAQQRGDQAALRALSDSMMKLMSPVAAAGAEGMAIAQRAQTRAEGAVEEIKRTCGEHPDRSRPRSPESPNALLPTNVYERLSETGARAAKLSPRQYAVLKERVGAYLALKQHGRGIAAAYAAAPGERAALDAAHPGFIGHQTQLADW